MKHPILPAGYNSWENDGDEVDGAGVNEPISPDYFDALEPGFPLILSSEMLAVFDGCADLVIACVPDTIVIPRQDDIVEIAA
jgi:hypothetical protein